MYECKWFNASQRFKKYTQFIIMRSQKSVRLKAGKFFAVSLEGFAGVRIHISSKLDKSVKSLMSNVLFLQAIIDCSVLM
jgi:hypothetical protein